MARPGVIFTESAAPASRGGPTDTATVFAVGVAERGPTDKAVLVHSMGEFTRTYGARLPNSRLYDDVDAALRQGAGRVYIARVVGAAAEVASVDLLGATGTSVVADAAGPGSWYNGLSVKALTASGGFKLQVLNGTTVLAESGTLVDNTEVAGFVNGYVVFSAGAGSSVPTTSATAHPLAGGDDDSDGLNQVSKDAALALFTRNLGPGRLIAPGENDSAMHEAMGAHASANNRIALVDLGDVGVVGTLTSAAATLSASGNASRLMLFAGAAKVPGTVGTTRTVSLSALQAGLEARKDRSGDVGVVAAFEDWPYRYVSDVTQTYSDNDYEVLVAAGVNVCLDSFGQFELFSYVTAESRTDGTYWMASAANVRMAIQAEAERIGLSFLGERLDGQGHGLGALEGALSGCLLRFYNDGSLFGELPSDAFEVICDFGNNPPSELQQGNVYASLNIRISPYAEYVVIDLVTTPITTSLAA